MKTDQSILNAVQMGESQSIAQIPGLPYAAVRQTISQEIGIGNVSISYSRPNAKKRKIYGGLVPYGVIWRTGANMATEITFSEDVKLNGQSVPAGAYSLFTIPGIDEWTIILNKDNKSWGAFSYDEKKDLLRIAVRVSQILGRQETFTILFANSTSSSAELEIVWGNTSVTICVSVDHDSKIMANIDRLMQLEHPDNLVYFNAVQYYYNNEKDVDKALGWIARAKNDVPASPAWQLFESRFLLRKGDKTAAIAAAEAGIKLAKDLNFDEYIALNSEALYLAKLQ